jgi:CarD family transcriptional regulator
MTKNSTAFTPGDVVVYPGHGLGKVTAIETQSVGGHRIDVFVIHFEHDNMTVRVPLQKAQASGLRMLSTRSVMQSALEKLKEPAAQRRAMWNRRSQEYAAKIKSGNPLSIAEVVRDLHCHGDRKQSNGERVLYEQALGRLTRECAAVEQTDVNTASAKLELILKAA